MKRIAIGKKTRFEVFKRDSFTCCYCGAKTPNVVLEIDHIIPVSKGGSNSLDNLVTSCFDCNRGKSNNDLSSVPLTIIQKTEIAAEKEAQYLEFKKVQSKIEKRIDNEIQKLCEVYEDYFPDYYLTNNFKQSIRKFIEKLGYYFVLQALHKSCSRLNANQSLKYFCGICWTKIKES